MKNLKLNIYLMRDDLLEQGKKEKKMIKLILLITFISNIIIAQSGGIKGIITANNQPLPGVNILFMETNYGGVTDADGNYSIKNIPSGDYSIRFSIVGYNSQTRDVEITANRIVEFNLEMIQQSIEMEEVRVVDSKIQTQDDTQTSLINLNPDQARVQPGAVTDVLRSLQSLPGVLAPNDFSSQLIVRGSGPDQNLMVMDDVEVFNPYRLYGVISMFNPESVSDINLITGGFPSRYGDRLSAVLDITNREGSTVKPVSGNLNASIVSANLLLEGRNPFSVPGSWLVSTRRTYYDLIVEPFVKETGLVEDNVSFPNFFDIQAKLSFIPFSGHKFLFNGVYSRDGVNVVSGDEREQPDSVSIFNESYNNLLSFAWHYTPHKNFFNKFIVSWYENSGDTDFDSKFLDPSLNRNDFEDAAPDTLAPYLVDIAFSSIFKFRKYSIEDRMNIFWGENYELEMGAGVDFMRTNLIIHFEVDPKLRAIINGNPNIRAVFDDIEDAKDYTRMKAYVHNNFMVSEKLYIQPGIRFDYYDILKKAYISPRISLAYSFDKLTTLRAVWGIYFQSIGYEKMRDRNILFDLSPKFTELLNAEKSFHYVLSIERWLTSEWRVKLEGYYKDFQNLITKRAVTGTGYYTEPVPGKDPRYSDSWTQPVTVSTDSLTNIPENNSFGEAYGFEFMLEKRNIAGFDRINGWISYALAKADRNEYNFWLPFQFDQLHTINVVLNYKLNHWLEFGMRFQYGSGFPITEAVGIKPRIIKIDTNGDMIPDTPVIATKGDTDEVVYDVDFGDLSNRFASRKPVYHRLDIRFSAEADYWNLDWIFYLDIINVYNRSNVIAYDYSVSPELILEREATTMFPIIPTFGFNLRF